MLTPDDTFKMSLGIFLQYESIGDFVSVFRNQKLHSRCICKCKGLRLATTIDSFRLARTPRLSYGLDWFSEERWWTQDHGNIELCVSSAGNRKVCVLND